MLTARERVFIDSCANCNTKYDLVDVAKACGFAWNEIAEMSTQHDGQIGPKSHLFRQVRNSSRELVSEGGWK